MTYSLHTYTCICIWDHYIHDNSSAHTCKTKYWVFFKDMYWSFPYKKNLRKHDVMRERDSIKEWFMCNRQKEREKKDRKKDIKGIKNS